MGNYLVALLFASLAVAQTMQDYPSQINRKPALDPRQFTFRYVNGASATRITVDLSTAGAKTATLTPAPFGTYGTSTRLKWRIGGGTGTAETVVSTGTGTCVPGSPSCTVTFTAVNTHTGAWAFESATAGGQEAVETAEATDSGGEVLYPAGIYQVYGSTRINAHTFIRCASPESTVINNNSTTGRVFEFISTGLNDRLTRAMGIEGCTITGGGVNSAQQDFNSETAIYIQDVNQHFFVTRNVIKNHAYGIRINGGYGITIKDNTIWHTSIDGIRAQLGSGGGDLKIIDTVVSNQSSTGTPDGLAAGIRILDWSGFHIQGRVETSYKKIGLYVSPSGTGTQFANFGFVDGLVSDTNELAGILLEAGAAGTIRAWRFTKTWAGFNGSTNGSTFSTAAPGFRTTGAGVDAISFSNGKLRENGGHGFDHQGGTNVDIENNQISANSQLTDNTYSGVIVAAGVSHWSVNGNRIGNFGSSLTNGQAYGVAVSAGASDHYAIIDNRFVSNDTGAIIDNGTGTDKQIYGNLPTGTSGEQLTLGGWMGITQSSAPVSAASTGRFRFSTANAMQMSWNGAAYTDIAGQNITNLFTVDQQISNDKKIFWKDSGGTARSMLWTDGSNDFHVGSQTAVAGDGKIFFWVDGVKRFSIHANPTLTLEPEADFGMTLGGSLRHLYLIHGYKVLLDYDGSGLRPSIQLQTPVASGSTVSLRAATTSGTSYALSFPPAGPTAGQMLQSDASGNFSWTSAAGLPVVDTTALVKGSVTDTKQVRIEADGLTAATTRVWTAQDADLTVAGIDVNNQFTTDQTMANNTKWLWKDSGGTARSMLWTDGSNDFHVGPQAAVAGDGKIHFWVDGVDRLNIHSNPTPQLEPSADFGLTLGSATKHLYNIHGYKLLLDYDGSGLRPAIVLQTGVASGSTVSLRAATTSGTSYAVTFPNAPPPGAGYLLQADAIGDLSWIVTPAGTVTSVTGTSPIVSSGGTTPAISCSTCIIETGTQTMSGTKTFTGGIIMNNASILVTSGTTVTFGAAAAGQRVTNIHNDNWTLYSSGAVTNGATLDISSGGTLDLNSGSTLTAPNGSNGVTQTCAAAPTAMTISGGIITAVTCI